MGFDDAFKKHLETLSEDLTECNPEDVIIRSLALDGVIGEAWTNFLQYAWQKDDSFKRDLKQYKIDLKTVGKEQADKNLEIRIKELLNKIASEDPPKEN